MAFLQCDFFSDVLGLSSNMSVILPQSTSSQVGLTGHAGRIPYPTLYLLHGRTDDHTIWMRRTAVERYATDYGLAVIMPAVHLSYYTDMAYGLRYWTFINDELPQIVRSFFPVAENRDDIFVAGLSMGGYGSFKLALQNPDRFAAAGSFSGVLDLAAFVDASPERADWELLFGSDPVLHDSDNDLLTLLDTRKRDGARIPDLYQCCGTADFLYENNQAFRSRAQALNISLTYEEEVGTEHTWDYWDRSIKRFLEWLAERGHLSHVKAE